MPANKQRRLLLDQHLLEQLAENVFIHFYWSERTGFRGGLKGMANQAIEVVPGSIGRNGQLVRQSNITEQILQSVEKQSRLLFRSLRQDMALAPQFGERLGTGLL